MDSKTYIGKKKGFQGKVFGLQLTDIIQMNCLSRVTTALTFTKDSEKGVIYLNEGEIVHAECGEEQGTDAFYKIMSWQEGEFVSNIGIVSPLQTIHQSWEHLLVEAMRRKAVEDGVGPMPKQKVIAQSLSSYDNPYQGPRRVRLDWTRPLKKAGKPVKDILKEPAPILYFVGCTGAYNVPERAIPQANCLRLQQTWTGLWHSGRKRTLLWLYGHETG
jgi:hypothetical protein